jgi:hypothetical protein
MLTKLEFGASRHPIAARLARQGYGAGGKNLKDEFDARQKQALDVWVRNKT